MLLHFEDEIPHLCTTFGILKAKGIVHAVQFGPNNQRIYRKARIRTKFRDSRIITRSGSQEPNTRRFGVILTLLALVNVVGADRGRQNDFVVVSL